MLGDCGVGLLGWGRPQGTRLWHCVMGPFVTRRDKGAGGPATTSLCPEDTTGQDGTEQSCQDPLCRHLVPR